MNKTRRLMMRWIRWYIQAKGYAPTIKEISKAMDMSYTYTIRNVRILRTHGYLSLDRYKMRSLTIIRMPYDADSEAA